MSVEIDGAMGGSGLIEISDNYSATRLVVQPTADWIIIFEHSLGNGGGFSWSESVDGGATWTVGEPALTDGNGAYWYDVYYERWNGPSYPNVIHVFENWDGSPRGGRYNRFDLSGGPGNITKVYATYQQAITTQVTLYGYSCAAVVALNGRIRLDIAENPLYAGEPGVYSDDDGATWTTTADTPREDNYDPMQAWPDKSTGNLDSIIIIYGDVSAGEFSLKRGFAGGGGFTETVFCTGLTGALYGTYSSTWDYTTGHIYFAVFTSDHATNSKDLRFYDIYGATVTAKTNPLTGITHCDQVSLSLTQTGDIWCFYTRDSSASGTNRELYYKISHDRGTTWGPETRYDDQDNLKNKLISDPLPLGGVNCFWVENGNLWALGTTTPITTTPYVLMLAEESSPDTPVLNYTPYAEAPLGQTIIKVERGKDAGVLGAPSRAGQGSVRIENSTLNHDVEHPLPGLAMRLNKFVDGVEYNLWQGHLERPTHFHGYQPTWNHFINLPAIGPLSRLAGKKVSTALYQDITVGTAIGHLLDAAGFPASHRDLDAGEVTLLWWWMDEADALTELWKLIASEGPTAELYERGDGVLVFRDRSARYVESRSTTAQSTFRSAAGSTAPLLSGFEYLSGDRREIANRARALRKRRLVGTPATVVWEEAMVYILGPSESITITMRSSDGSPFKDAITPVLGTDFTVAIGSVTPVLNRTSGMSVDCTFTAGAGGALFGHDGGITIDAMQLRATPVSEIAAVYELNTLDASASITQYGLRPWTGEVWPEIDWPDMRDTLDAWIYWKMVPRALIRFNVESLTSTAADLATAERQIGDRVRVIDSSLSVDAQAWIEKVTHSIDSPVRHVASYECSVIESDIETDPYTAIDNSSVVWTDPYPSGGDDGMLLRGVSIL